MRRSAFWFASCYSEQLSFLGLFSSSIKWSHLVFLMGRDMFFLFFGGREKHFHLTEAPLVCQMFVLLTDSSCKPTSVERDSRVCTWQDWSWVVGD